MRDLVQSAVDALSLGGMYALMALGIALVFGVMQLVNFAHGELISAAAYLLLILSGLPVGVALTGALLGVLSLAVAMEKVAFRPVRSADPTTLLVTSFALSILLQNVIVLLAGARARSVNVLGDLNAPVSVLGVGMPIISLVTMAVTVALVLGLTAFLSRTPIGVHVRAASEDFSTARLLGVRANRVIATCFAVSGALAFAVGALLLVQTGTASPAAGLQPVLIAFVATVLGGMGNLRGAAIAGGALGVATVVLQATLPDAMVVYRDALLFALVIACLLVRPDGLFGRPKVVQRA